MPVNPVAESGATVADGATGQETADQGTAHSGTDSDSAQNSDEQQGKTAPGATAPLAKSDDSGQDGGSDAAVTEVGEPAPEVSPND